MKHLVRNLAVGLALVALLVPLGCGQTEEEDRAQVKKDRAAEAVAKPGTNDGLTFTEDNIAYGPTTTVMQYEDGAEDPLVGGWSYTGMNYTPANKQWGKGRLWPDTELHTVTFVKQGETYSLQGSPDYTVTFDGTNVTITGAPAGSLQSKYSGVLKGDTITGTRHHVGGKLVYDGPWNATRAK